MRYTIPAARCQDGAGKSTDCFALPAFLIGEADGIALDESGVGWYNAEKKLKSTQ